MEKPRLKGAMEQLYESQGIDLLAAQARNKFFEKKAKEKGKPHHKHASNYTPPKKKLRK